jgi:hypothetical protein
MLRSLRHDVFHPVGRPTQHGGHHDVALRHTHGLAAAVVCAPCHGFRCRICLQVADRTFCPDRRGRPLHVHFPATTHLRLVRSGYFGLAHSSRAYALGIRAYAQRRSLERSPRNRDRSGRSETCKSSILQTETDIDGVTTVAQLFRILGQRGTSLIWNPCSRGTRVRFAESVGDLRYHCCNRLLFAYRGQLLCVGVKCDRVLALPS